ncbi:MAG: hypothetical protein ACOVOV_17810 [Dolichospermum sp.]
MNYTINANIYEIVDLNYKKKNAKGVLINSDYKKEQVKKRAFSLSTGAGVANLTADEIIANVKTKLNLPDNVVDIKLTVQGKDLVGTEIVTAYGVKFDASFPCKTPHQGVETPVEETPVAPVVEEAPVVETPVAPVVEEAPVVETPAVEETPED